MVIRRGSSVRLAIIFSFSLMSQLFLQHIYFEKNMGTHQAVYMQGMQTMHVLPSGFTNTFMGNGCFFYTYYSCNWSPVTFFFFFFPLSHQILHYICLYTCVQSRQE